MRIDASLLLKHRTLIFRHSANRNGELSIRLAFLRFPWMRRNPGNVFISGSFGGECRSTGLKSRRST
jgi:hypothetical protein